MFNLTSTYYHTSESSLKVLHLLASGLTQDEIAEKLKITASNLRHRITQLKLKLGVTSTEQLMFEFGKYKLYQEATTPRPPYPHKLFRSIEMQHCLNCPKNKPVQDLKEYIKSICGK